MAAILTHRNTATLTLTPAVCPLDGLACGEPGCEWCAPGWAGTGSTYHPNPADEMALAS